MLFKIQWRSVYELVGHISRNEASVHGHESFKDSLNDLYIDNFTNILL
jgi:hypothetical protein